MSTAPIKHRSWPFAFRAYVQLLQGCAISSVEEQEIHDLLTYWVQLFLGSDPHVRRFEADVVSKLPAWILSQVMPLFWERLYHQLATTFRGKPPQLAIAYVAFFLHRKPVEEREETLRRLRPELQGKIRVYLRRIDDDSYTGMLR